jgi:uncharacterized protein involved in exopolysaccharide biosynthesis
MEKNDMKCVKLYDVHHLWKMFTDNKKWFALSVVLCLFCGLLYIYFTHPVFRVTGKVLITEKKSSSSGTSNAALLLSSQLPLGLGSSLGGSIGVENEKEILSSKLLARNVVNQLGLHTQYRIHQFLRSRLVYKSQPIHVAVSPEMIQLMDDALPTISHRISLSVYKSADGFCVEGIVYSGKNKTELPEQQFAQLPFTVSTSLGDLVLSENKALTAEQKKPYQKDYQMDVTIIPPTLAAQQFSKRIAIGSASKKATSTVVLSMKDENVLRGYDYINSLVDEYNAFSTEEKHKEVSKYDQFVKERLTMVDRDLGLSDENWENYKKRYQVTDTRVDAEEVMKKKSGYESQIVGLGIQLQLLNYMKEYVDDPANVYEIIPVNLGSLVSSSVSSSDAVSASSSNASLGDVVTVIVRHNSLVTERNLLLKSATEKSPQVVRVTAMLDELQPVIKNALKRDIESLRLRSNSLEREYNKYMGRVADAPEQERALTEIGRQRKIKEGVYLSLLQKREENAMDLINTVDKGRFIDMVQYDRKVKPRGKIVMLIALLMGLLLPFIVISLYRWLRGTVRGIDDMKELTKLPILGEIPHDSIQTDEAFISIRSNLLHQMGAHHKVVLVTSNGQGEGKTYHAIHLAKSLSETGKRVVLCDLNFRHPSVAKELGIHLGAGLGQLLVRENVTKEMILSALTKPASSDVEVLGTGDPLNVHPANLLGREQLCTVINVLKQDYDYVILDTPAIGPFNDVLIDGLGDVTYYICQSGKAPKTSVARLNQLAEEGRLSSPCIIINHL